MLDIYPFILETIAALRPVAGRIARADADLGRQLRRAQASIALNVAEGAYSRGRNRQARYHTALGSARDTRVSRSCRRPGACRRTRYRGHCPLRPHYWYPRSPRRRPIAASYGRGGPNGDKNFGFRSATFVTRAYNRLLRPGLAILSSSKPTQPAPLRRAVQKVDEVIEKMWCDAA